MPALKELLNEILPLRSWKEIEKRFIIFRRREKFVPKKNVVYHLYMAQEVNIGRTPGDLLLLRLLAPQFFFIRDAPTDTAAMQGACLTTRCHRLNVLTIYLCVRFLLLLRSCTVARLCAGPGKTYVKLRNCRVRTRHVAQRHPTLWLVA